MLMVVFAFSRFYTVCSYIMHLGLSTVNEGQFDETIPTSNIPKRIKHINISQEFETEYEEELNAVENIDGTSRKSKKKLIYQGYKKNNETVKTTQAVFTEHGSENNDGRRDAYVDINENLYRTRRFNEYKDANAIVDSTEHTTLSENTDKEYYLANIHETRFTLFPIKKTTFMTLRNEQTTIDSIESGDIIVPLLKYIDLSNFKMSYRNEHSQKEDIRSNTDDNVYFDIPIGHLNSNNQPVASNDNLNKQYMNAPKVAMPNENTYQPLKLANQQLVNRNTNDIPMNSYHKQNTNNNPQNNVGITQNTYNQNDDQLYNPYDIFGQQVTHNIYSNTPQYIDYNVIQNDDSKIRNDETVLSPNAVESIASEVKHTDKIQYGVPEGILSRNNPELAMKLNLTDPNDLKFVEAALHQMAAQQIGYFSVFLDNFFQSFTSKSGEALIPLYDALLNECAYVNKFNYNYGKALRKFLMEVKSMPPAIVEQKADMIRKYAVADQNANIELEYISLIGYVDYLLQESDNTELFKAAAIFDRYPRSSNISEVYNALSKAIHKSLDRLKKDYKLKVLVTAINKIVQQYMYGSVKGYRRAIGIRHLNNSKNINRIAITEIENDDKIIGKNKRVNVSNESRDLNENKEKHVKNRRLFKKQQTSSSFHSKTRTINGGTRRFKKPKTNQQIASASNRMHFNNVQSDTSTQIDRFHKDNLVNKTVKRQKTTQIRNNYNNHKDKYQVAHKQFDDNLVRYDHVISEDISNKNNKYDVDRSSFQRFSNIKANVSDTGNVTSKTSKKNTEADKWVDVTTVSLSPEKVPRKLINIDAMIINKFANFKRVEGEEDGVDEFDKKEQTSSLSDEEIPLRISLSKVLYNKTFLENARRYYYRRSKLSQLREVSSYSSEEVSLKSNIYKAFNY